MSKKIFILVILSILAGFLVFGCESVTVDSSGTGISGGGAEDSNIARPAATLSNDNWTVEGADTLHEATDESTANDDSDYIEAVGVNAVVEFDLGSVLWDQITGEGQLQKKEGPRTIDALFRYRAAGDRPGEGVPDAKLTMEVYQGGILLASSGARLITDGLTYQDYSFTLTIWEVNAETGSGDLKLKISITGLDGGKGDLVRITFVEMQVPAPEAEEPGGGDPEPPAEDPLAIRNGIRSPNRLFQGPDGKIYMTDPQVGSVFIFSEGITKLLGELKGFAVPLGVAVDSSNRIYVGNDGRDNVEVFTEDGVKLGAIGHGLIRMPSALGIDSLDNLYVVDSIMNTVFVFNPSGSLIRKIGSSGEGDGELRFPVALAFRVNEQGQEEIFVADQGHNKIQVFTLQGEYLQTHGGELGDDAARTVREARELDMDLSDENTMAKRGMDLCDWSPTMSSCIARCEENSSLSFCPKICNSEPNHPWCEGYEPPPPPAEPISFNKIQSLAVDSTGKIHALDIMNHWVQIFDPTDDSGLTSGSYGTRGSKARQLLVPKDIIIDNNGQVIVSNSGSIRVEVIHTVTE